MTTPTLFLKPDRDRSVRRRHPWVFSGAVARVEGTATPGDVAAVRSAAGEFLAWAAYNPHSQIVGRIWAWAEAENVDGDFFARRLARAIRARAALAETTDAIRWVNAESDGLPGLVVDRYADFAVCQFLTAGVERWKAEIVAALAQLPDLRGIYERSDVEVRGKEGLKSSEGLLWGARPPELIEVWEAASPAPRRFGVDVLRGHKTGFYLDQRDNRNIVAQYALNQKVLNVFAYTGAFTVSAWQGGAQSVTSIDSSGPALAMAHQNLALNNLPATDLVEADAFKILREYRDHDQTFDLIILDPPKFAQSEAQINRASRAYKDINWLAFRLLNPGGHLITFSCSGLISEDLFQKILFGAALDAGREIQIIRRLGQASDHPVLLTFPEAAYLKGFVCQWLA